MSIRTPNQEQDARGKGIAQAHGAGASANVTEYNYNPPTKPGCYATFGKASIAVVLPLLLAIMAGLYNYRVNQPNIPIEFSPTYELTSALQVTKTPVSTPLLPSPTSTRRPTSTPIPTPTSTITPHLTRPTQTPKPPTSTATLTPTPTKNTTMNIEPCPLILDSPTDFAQFKTADEIKLQWSSPGRLKSEQSYRLSFYTTDGVFLIGLLTKDTFSTKPAGTPAWVYLNGEWIAQVKENGTFKWGVEVVDSNNNVLCQSELRTFSWLLQ